MQYVPSLEHLEPRLLGIAQVAGESRGLFVVREQHLNCRHVGLRAKVSWDRCVGAVLEGKLQGLRRQGVAMQTAALC